MIEYEGESYLDDRLYILELRRTEVNGEKKISVATFRNVRHYAPTRTDEFDHMNDAIAFIKKIEPHTPLISLGGKPIKYDEDEDVWKAWIKWMKEKELQSPLIGEFEYLKDKQPHIYRKNIKNLSLTKTDEE